LAAPGAIAENLAQFWARTSAPSEFIRMIQTSRGENISAYFTNKFTVIKPVQRVNVDLTQGMLRELDERAARLNVSRRSSKPYWITHWKKLAPQNPDREEKLSPLDAAAQNLIRRRQSANDLA
jgi:hypothetical protein